MTYATIKLRQIELFVLKSQFLFLSKTFLLFWDLFSSFLSCVFLAVTDLVSVHSLKCGVIYTDMSSCEKRGY